MSEDTSYTSYARREARERELGLHDQGKLVVRDVQHIVDIVAFIQTINGDDESAHATLDQLCLATLRAIANGADDPATLATEALKANDIDFSRWYA